MEHDRLLDEVQLDATDLGVAQARVEVLRQATAHIEAVETKQQLLRGLYEARLPCSAMI